MKMRAGRITELCYTCLGKMTDTLSSFYMVVYTDFYTIIAIQVAIPGFPPTMVNDDPAVKSM